MFVVFYTCDKTLFGDVFEGTWSCRAHTLHSSTVTRLVFTDVQRCRLEGVSVDRAMRGQTCVCAVVEPKKTERPSKACLRANLNLEQHGGPYRSVLE